MQLARPQAASQPDDAGAASCPRLEISLSALRANLTALRQRVGSTEIAAAVKADAYGLGVADIAPVLLSAGVTRFFVANVAEGMTLRAVLEAADSARRMDKPPELLILNGCQGEEWRQALRFGLTPVLNSPAAVREWRQSGCPVGAVLHVDTGMNRLGLRPEDLAGLGIAQPALVMSHLACADLPGDPLNLRQLKAFRSVLAEFPTGTRASLSATGGALLGTDYHFDIIRAGIGLYGGGLPENERHAVGRLSAPIVQVRTVLPGESVGYGASFVATQPMRLGIAAIGYADGFLRSASGRGMGWIAGARVPVVGRVSMDLTAFDLSQLTSPVNEGDSIELFGEHMDIQDAANSMQTISYEVLTSLRGSRLIRTVRP